MPDTHEAQDALAFVKPAIARADIALDAPVFEPVPIAARNTFQTLGFGHGIRRVNRWADLSLLPTGVTEACHDIEPGPSRGTNARGRRLILFLMGGDGKPSRQQFRPLRSRVLPPLQHCYSPQAFVPGGEAMRMMPAATDRDEALPAHSSQSSIKRGQWLLRALAGSRRRGRRQMPTHKFVGSRQILQCVGQIKIAPRPQAF